MTCFRDEERGKWWCPNDYDTANAIHQANPGSQLVAETVNGQVQYEVLDAPQVPTEG
jgi:hypothetical protein